MYRFIQNSLTALISTEQNTLILRDLLNISEYDWILGFFIGICILLALTLTSPIWFCFFISKHVTVKMISRLYSLWWRK